MTYVPEEKNCEWCGKPFFAKQRNFRFCCDQCRQKAANKRRGNTLQVKTCLNPDCGQEFEGFSNKLYCCTKFGRDVTNWEVHTRLYLYWSNNRPVCSNCGRVIYPGSDLRNMSKTAKHWCSRPECRSARDKYLQREWRRRKKRLREKHKVTNRRVVANKAPKDWKRKCKRCGKSSWPNYFYCPECHTLVSKNSEMNGIADSEIMGGGITSNTPTIPTTSPESKLWLWGSF